MERQLKDLIYAIEVLKVQKGDAVVLKYDGKISQSTYENVKTFMEGILKRMGKENIPVIILEAGLDIEILRLREGK